MPVETAGESVVRLLPCAKRIRAFVKETAIADSAATLLVMERGHYPVHYFPRKDVRMDLLKESAHTTSCPHKGLAHYWSIEVAGKTAENAVWGYTQPKNGLGELKDYLAFEWKKVDRWMEEDEELVGHARDPYHRIDILRSSRPVKVRLAGAVIAESRNALFLFETGLRPRYYIPRRDVRAELLRESKSQTLCPYKGRASYWSATVGGKAFDDIAWEYRNPIPESARLKDHLCFYDEKVEGIEVGEPKEAAA